LSISQVTVVISRSKSLTNRIRLSSLPPGTGGQLEAGKELTAPGSEQVCVLGRDPLGGQAPRAPGDRTTYWSATRDRMD